jgi:predicted dienelactone hydrolase
MLRVFSTILLSAGLIISSACSPDQSAVATTSQIQSVETTIQSRGVAVPVTFAVPVSDEPRKHPIVIMAHGHGGSREEVGGFRLVAKSLAKRGVASIRVTKRW